MSATPAEMNGRKANRSTDVAEFLRILHPDGDVFEIRIPGTAEVKGGKFKATASGYFNNVDEAAKFVLHWSRPEPTGVYATINPVDGAMLARANNKIHFKVKHTTESADIVKRRWLFIDIDPIRPKGVSATESESIRAREKGATIFKWLRDREWPMPLRMMSGNGCYLLYRIDLENDQFSGDLVKGFINAIADRFTDEFVDIDRKVFDANRIAKVAGTWARKGENAINIPGQDDRPHRQAYFIVPDDELQTVDVELIRSVVREADELRDREAEAAREKKRSERRSANLEYGSRSIRYGDLERVAIARKAMEKVPVPPNENDGSSRVMSYARQAVRFDLPDGHAVPLIESMLTANPTPREYSSDEITKRLSEVDQSIRGEGFDNANGELAGLDKSEKGKTSEPYFTLINAAELAAGDFALHYLIPGMLAALQPLIIAGQFKSLKTSIALEIALSLASGTKFLGRFEVPERKRVLVLTAESGLATVQESCFRICKSHFVDLASLEDHFVVTDRVPFLTSASQTAELAEIIRKGEFDAVIADPAYLMLDGDNAGNLFSMGDQLRVFAELALAEKCTPVLVHHAKKNNLNNTEFQPLELGDIAWAGFAEFARQWLLLSRQERYVEGTGDHRIWMSVGGSAGHNGCWGLDIAEGHPDDDGGRKWDVTVSNASESREIAEVRKEEARESKKQRAVNRNAQKLRDALIGAGRNGLTKSDAFDRAGLSFRGSGGAALAVLLNDEILETCLVKKSNGQEYEGFRLSTAELDRAKREAENDEDLFPGFD